MNSPAQYIAVNDRGRKHLLAVDDILHVEAVRIYSIFHMRGTGRQFVSSVNLGRVLQQLDPGQFLRVHRSHIVNLYEIKACQLARGGKVILSNNVEIEVAQRRKTQLLQHLKQLNRKLALSSSKGQRTENLNLNPEHAPIIAQKKKT